MMRNGTAREDGEHVDDPRVRGFRPDDGRRLTDRQGYGVGGRAKLRPRDPGYASLAQS